MIFKYKFYYLIHSFREKMWFITFPKGVHTLNEYNESDF